MLRFLKEDYAGIVLPAHILAYSSKATIAALRYIDKPYFIDPMTYIYAKGLLDGYQVWKEKDRKNHLKPSIVKLTQDLSLTDVFPEIDTKPLDIDDFDDELIKKIAKGNVDLQLNRVNKGIGSSTPKLDSLLAEIGQPPSEEQSKYPPPIFVTTPYFLIPEKKASAWIDINVKLAVETRKLVPKSIEVRPIILTFTKNLNESLIDKYKDFDNFVVWIEDLKESECSVGDQQVKKLSLFKKFIFNSSEKGKRFINLYGSYFSAILLKNGLEAFCNGPLYGEYKSSTASLGGIPPVRVYIPSIHKFYIYSQAMEILELNPDFYDKFPEQSKKIFKSKQELAKILDDVTLAQEHFINCRNQEIDYVLGNEMNEIVTSLSNAYEAVGTFEQRSLRNKEPHQLLAWIKALNEEQEEK